MKTGKNAISYLLLIICICMQMAMAYPHHHHSDAICVATDLINCPSDECNDTHQCHHHTDDADSHSCSSTCITKFECGTPYHAPHIVPHYTLCISTYEPRIPASPEFKVYHERAIFCEKLHTQAVACAKRLRAPPTLS